MLKIHSPFPAKPKPTLNLWNWLLLFWNITVQPTTGFWLRIGVLASSSYLITLLMPNGPSWPGTFVWWKVLTEPATEELRSWTRARTRISWTPTWTLDHLQTANIGRLVYDLLPPEEEPCYLVRGKIPRDSCRLLVFDFAGLRITNNVMWIESTDLFFNNYVIGYSGHLGFLT